MTAGGQQRGIAIPFTIALAGIGVFSTMDAVMKGLALSLGAYNSLLWRTAAGAGLGGAGFLLRRVRWPGRAALRIHLIPGGLARRVGGLFFWGAGRRAVGAGVGLGLLAPVVAA